MLDQLHAAGRSASHAIGLIVARTASVDLRWLAAGTILYFVAQAVRTRGWYTILRAAYPEATDLRAGHVARAYLAGAGVNAIVPARGGDVIKLAMVHRRIDGSRYRRSPRPSSPTPCARPRSARRSSRGRWPTGSCRSRPLTASCRGSTSRWWSTTRSPQRC